MVPKNRIPKTLLRKLKDLDDHLYFLKESLARLSNGDNAYLKSLTVELRVLVCQASGTEGLLWRVINKLSLLDVVHVHLAGNLNRSHPLAKGLQFSFVPIFRAGQGDPRLTPAHYSLKAIIKECEALVVSGGSYTYEKLIRAVAEQMGSAHEDEGVEPHLVELSGIVMSNQVLLNSALMSVGDLVLEVGERVLSEARQNLNFNRKARAEIVIPSQLVQSNSDTHDADFEGECTSPLSPEGSLGFFMDIKDIDWKTNVQNYNFGECRWGPLKLRILKHSDKTMEVRVEGLAADVLVARKPIPESEQSGVAVAFTWGKGEAIFYLNGKRVDTIEYEITG